ncbi:MAG: hypothetical protein ACK526_00235 [Planctomyces sp.]|jgi:hypothetical protein
MDDDSVVFPNINPDDSDRRSSSEQQNLGPSKKSLRAVSSQNFWRLFPVLLVLSGCLSVPGSSGPMTNALQFPISQRDVMWERAVHALNRSHFSVVRESKLEGIIETDYRAGSNLVEVWHPDSIGFSNRLESTLQSIRRRILVTMKTTGPDVMTLSVRAEKELEDLPGLAAVNEGGATFPEAQPMKRDLAPVVGQSGPSRWVPMGRDVLLERAIIQRMQGGY